MSYDEEHKILYVYERAKSGQYQIVTLQRDQGKWKLAGYHESQELLTEIKKVTTIIK